MPNAGRITFTGSTLLQPVLAVGSNVIPLSPSVTFGQELFTLASIFDEFRFTMVEFVYHQSASGSPASVLAYSPEVQQVIPTTLLAGEQIPNSILIPAATIETVPHALLVTKGTLIGSAAAKWWKCIPSAAADDWDEIQGTINIITGAINTPTIEMRFVVQFCSIHSPNPNQLATRRAIASRWAKLPVIDMYLPDSAFPFPDGLKVDEEMRRVSKLYSDLHGKTADKERARLALITQ